MGRTRMTWVLGLLGGLAATGSEVIDLAPYVVVAPSLAVPAVALEATQLRESKPIDLAEVLSSEIPSIALSRKGPTAGDLLLRGLSKDNLLITVDGTKTFCACPNRMDPPAFHVSSQQIAQIRIRSGPFTVSEGATPGGAVFVRTEPASAGDRLRLYAFAGAFETLAGGISGNLLSGSEHLRAQGGLYYQEGGVFEDGDGRPFTSLPGTGYLPGMDGATAFRIINAEAKVSVDIGTGAVMQAGAGYQDASDVLYPGLKMDALTDTMRRANLGFLVPVDWAIAEELEISIAASEVDHDMQDRFRSSTQMNPAFAARGFMMRTESRTGFRGAGIRASLPGEDSLLRYGLDWQRRTWNADNVVMMQENPMLPDVRQRTLGAWAVHEARRGKWSFETGLRLDRAESKARDSIAFVQQLWQTPRNRACDTMVSGYGLASYALRDGLDVYAGIGRGLRLPDPQERYLNLNRPGSRPDWVGNPELDPVENTELQAGFQYRKDRVSLQGSLFYARLRDYIYLAALPSGGGSTYRSLDARLYGFDATARWRPDEELSFEAGLAWQKGLKDGPPAWSTNRVLAEIPPLRGRLAANWAKQRWRIRLEALFQEDLDRIDPDLQEHPLGGWVVLNALVQWQALDGLSVSAGVDNIADKAYAVSNSFLRDPFRSGVTVNEPGRFLYIRTTAEW